MSERSSPPNATLTTRAGRVFPAKPKSMSQTSPRAGIVLIEPLKQLGRSHANLLVRQGTGVKRQRTAQNLVSEDALLLNGKAFECFEERRGFLSHRFSITLSPARSFT